MFDYTSTQRYFLHTGANLAALGGPAIENDNLYDVNANTQSNGLALRLGFSP